MKLYVHPERIGGEVFGRMDVRSKISADGAVDLNYRKNKLDLFAYYGYSEKQREIDINSMQTLEAEENITAVQQIATQRSIISFIIWREDSTMN